MRTAHHELADPASHYPYTYTCEIASDAKLPYQQHYPPRRRRQTHDMDSLKRALKSLFKRSGKKDKKEQGGQSQRPNRTTTPTTAGGHQRGPATPAKDTPTSQKIVADRPPRLPHPITKDEVKEVPPTHPLATGRHGDTREAVPVDHDVKLGSAPGPTIAGGRKEEEQVKQGGVGIAEGKDSKQVSPVKAQEAPAPPPKEDGVADAIVAAPEAAAAAAPAGTRSASSASKH